MILTVTLNPSLDETVTVRGLVIDETNRWFSLRKDPGGKGINASRVIHELGGETFALGFIGGHDGIMVENLLREEGVHFEFVHIKKETRTNFIITDVKAHQQTRITAPGPRISVSELEKLETKIREFKPKPDFLVLSGSVPPGVPNDIYARLIYEAKAAGVKVALDSEGKWLREGVKAKPFVIKPNVKETEELLNIKLDSEAAIVEAAQSLVAQGIQIVVISRARDGIIAATKDSKILEAIPPTVEVKSTVGAGDSALAALVLRLSQKATLEEACRWAVAAGTAATLTPGTQLCRRRDVERLLPRVVVREVKR